MHSIARSPRTARASAWLALATIAALLLSLLAITRPALADAPGNNGTVKIHEGATEEEPIVANDPHVCTFHLHFFFGDDVQAGDWWIEQWAPDDMGTVVLTGTYDATNGEDRQPEQGVYDLPDGHYKLFWEGATNPGGQTEIKHKVFWVDCQPSAECTTWFFGSATVGTEFHQGDTWQGGTFTTIENDHYMLVRDEADGTTVGRFPMGFLLGDSATITFSQPIHIQQILWHDNDPKAGEQGWSFNGIAGPLTGNQLSVFQDVDITTSVVNIDAGGDSGGIDFCF